MRIDLHTHSRASDGTQTPAELMRAASAAGLDVVAITDHDTCAGWAEAERAAYDVSITLVRGMEISTKFRGKGVHLLGYLPDPTYEPLVQGLVRILDGRNGRVPGIVERLQGIGIDIAEDDVHRLAGDPAAVGRPHVADALIDLDVVVDRKEAFAKYLNPGRPAYVNRYAAPLEEMIATVAGAGGVTVVAHPWGRGRAEDLDEAAFAHLLEVGLSGIEVDHQDHDASSRTALRGIARNLDLVVTGSSDHHGAGKVNHELGCNTTDPEEFDRLLERARAAAGASGRGTPEVLTR
ncbi:MAG: PHP domain-containing protein [Nocardioides sp.]|nr:PHP domain-containing protein [Nocardioides sp.]